MIQIDSRVWWFIQIILFYFVSRLFTFMETALTWLAFFFIACCFLIPSIRPRIFIIVLTIFLALGSGAIFYTQFHAALPPSQTHTSDTLTAMHVSAQTLLQGKNPYSTDFFGTELDELGKDKYEISYWNDLGLERNPALYHYAYIPGSFLLPAALYSVVGEFDLRLLFALVLIIGLLLWLFSFSDKELGITVILLFLILIRLGGFLLGVNDMLVIGLCMVSAWLMWKNYDFAAAILWGVTASLKQTAWPLLVFVLIWAYWNKKLNPYAIAPIMVAITIIPFVVWDPAAYVDDTIFYFSGNTANAYPINPEGGGIPMMLEWLRFSKEQINQFPYFLLQLLFTLPIFGFLVKKFKSNPKLENIFIYSGILILAFTLVYKNFNFNYLNFAFSLILIGVMLSISNNIQLQTAKLRLL